MRIRDRDVTPPVLRAREPPHIPVPSIIMGFMETMLFSPCFWQVLTTNFIMISGPMVMTKIGRASCRERVCQYV